MYSVEFGGLSNDIQYGEYVGYNYGLKKEETLVIAGINENLDGVNDSISNYMQGGKLVITKAQMEAKQGRNWIAYAIFVFVSECKGQCGFQCGFRNKAGRRN